MDVLIDNLLTSFQVDSIGNLPISVQRLVSLYIDEKPEKKLWANIWRVLSDETVRGGGKITELERTGLAGEIAARLERLEEVDRLTLTKQVLSSELMDERKLYLDVDMLDRYQKERLSKYKLTLMRKYGQKDKSFGIIPLRQEFEKLLGKNKYTEAKLNIYAIGFQCMLIKHKFDYGSVVSLQNRLEQSAAVRGVLDKGLAQLLQKMVKSYRVDGGLVNNFTDIRPSINFINPIK